MSKYKDAMGTEVDINALLGRMGRRANNNLIDLDTRVLLSQAMIVIWHYRDADEAIRPVNKIQIPKDYLK